MRGRVLFSPGGPPEREGVSWRCVPSSVTGPRKEKQRGGRVHGAVWMPRSHGGDVFPLGSVIKLSVGQRGLNALHRGRGERDGERERDVQPHMHLLTTSYFHSHE